MEILSMDNVLTGDDAANLFIDTGSTEEKAKEPETEKETKDTTTEETDPDSLFESSEENPESVGSEGDTQGEQEDTTASTEATGTSPNIFSSLTSALKEDGIFPDLDDNDIKDDMTAEDFRSIIEKQIAAGIDETTNRVNKLLQSGVEPSVIKKYEDTIKFLNSITDAQITDESEEGETLRRNLLLQDFMNRGYSRERAASMTEKLISKGEDIDEAKQALEGNKEYFGNEYKKLQEDAKREEEEEAKRTKKQAEDLKNDILSNEKAFGTIALDKKTRQKVYDNITKPIWKDPETGEYYTQLQKYRMEHEADFIKNVGLLFTLTDGFKNIDNLVKPEVKKEVKSALAELETKLKNTERQGGDSMKYAGNRKNSENNPFDDGFIINI